eukprot:IDg7792t1
MQVISDGVRTTIRRGCRYGRAARSACDYRTHPTKGQDRDRWEIQQRRHQADRSVTTIPA